MLKRALGIMVILALLVSSATFFSNSLPAAAKDDKFQLAPINPDALESASPYGYRPPTMDLSHIKRISAQEAMALLSQQPISWDWRDYGKVTPVKDQNPCGTCWAFGTTSVLESAALLGESVEYDFSEQSVALCVDRAWVYLYDQADDPCGLIPGHAGGNSLKASEVFIKKGAVLESCNPYDTDGLQCDGTCTCDSCPSVKKVTGYRYVTNDGSQIALIKAAVSDRPVTMSFYYDPTAVYSDETYGTIYDYYPCSENANHLVSIIGWDDAVPHPDLDHSGTGAWLVKNSWGTGWGNSGYFWLAYDSSSVTEIAYLEYGDYNATETLYYWDEVGSIDAGGYGDTSAWMASVFTSGQNGDLTYVDFWTTSNDASYEIYVYDGFFGSQLASKTGSCAEPGYYSMPLTTPVPVTNGQQFTVAVKMTTPGFDYPIPVEYEITDYCEPSIQSGVCYVRYQVGDSWEDAEPYGVNVCLRARITAPEPQTISVVLQGGARPDEGWAVPITIKFFSPGADVMTDTPIEQFDLTTTKSDGTATCQCAVMFDTYDITAVSEHTLLNVKRDVAISTPSTAVDMGTLLEGNANDDSIINISDFGILAVSYLKEEGEPGYDARADFDRNGIINISDFGLLAVNYLKVSPVDVSE